MSTIALPFEHIAKCLLSDRIDCSFLYKAFDGHLNQKTALKHIQELLQLTGGKILPHIVENVSFLRAWQKENFASC